MLRIFGTMDFEELRMRKFISSRKEKNQGFLQAMEVLVTYLAVSVRGPFWDRRCALS